MLVADEPTTGARRDDPGRESSTDAATSASGSGRRSSLITHNLGVVADIADRVLVMYAGPQGRGGAVDELFARPQHPYTLGLLGAIPRPEAPDTDGRLREIPGRVPSLTGPWSACAFADRCPRADERTRSEVPPLQEVEHRHLVACFHPGSR
jgi:peptide/nickel transport system ATP-binding protein